MLVNLSSDRLLHLLILIIASGFFGFVVQYWTESGRLFSFSGGVTIAVQLSNVIQKLRNSSENNENENETENTLCDIDEKSDEVIGKKRPNKKQLKGVQRRKEKHTQ
jgi:hypothetical protein